MLYTPRELIHFVESRSEAAFGLDEFAAILSHFTFSCLRITEITRVACDCLLIALFFIFPSERGRIKIPAEVKRCGMFSHSKYCSQNNGEKRFVAHKKLLKMQKFHENDALIMQKVYIFCYVITFYPQFKAVKVCVRNFPT